MSVIERLRQKKAQLFAVIEEQYKCAHPQREIRLRIIKEGRPAYYRQCIRCGHAGRAISHKDVIKESHGNPIPDFHDDAAYLWEKEKSEQYSHAAYEIDQEFQLIYEDYLLSDQWKEKRTLVLARANGICEVCEISEAVNIHHTIYENLCFEPLEDLMAVCKFCHDYLHGKIKL